MQHCSLYKKNSQKLSCKKSHQSHQNSVSHRIVPSFSPLKKSPNLSPKPKNLSPKRYHLSPKSPKRYHLLQSKKKGHRSNRIKILPKNTFQNSQSVSKLSYFYFDKLATPKGGRFCYQQSTLKNLSLTRSPAQVVAPT